MAVSNDPLPPPRSGQFLEVSFRRLLKSCKEIMAGDNKGRLDLDAWRSSPVFHHYVETLQEQLSDLETDGTKRVLPEVLERYKEEFTAIADQLDKPNVPAFCLPPPKQGRITSNAAATPLELEGVRQRSSRSATTAFLSEGAQRRLATQANLQDTLTDELVGMAAALKTNTQAYESRLRERDKLLADTDAALDQSLENTKRSRSRAGQIYQRNTIGFCRTCLVLVVVGVMFAGMYLFIQSSYWLGFKQ